MLSPVCSFLPLLHKRVVSLEESGEWGPSEGPSVWVGPFRQGGEGRWGRCFEFLFSEDACGQCKGQSLAGASSLHLCSQHHSGKRDAPAEGHPH